MQARKLQPRPQPEIIYNEYFDTVEYRVKYGINQSPCFLNISISKFLQQFYYQICDKLIRPNKYLIFAGLNFNKYSNFYAY